MSQSINLNHLEKESRGLFSQDGLLYVFCGLILLLVGASFIWSGLTLLVGFCAFLIYPVEWLRRRITYPRIGYARFSVPRGTLRYILLFAVLSVVALATLGLAADGRFQRYLPLAISAVFALSFYFGVSMHGVRPAEWALILIAVASGLFASWRYSDWHDGAAFTLGFTGLVFLLYGLVKLAFFLRNYLRPQDGNRT